MTSDTKLIEARVQRLELELEQATERLWKARLAVKEAKALAKVARKARKQARKSLAIAQSELEPDGDHAGRKAVSKKKKDPGKRKIAESPERTRKPRKRAAKVQPPAEAPTATAEPVAEPGPQ